jgi:hypothetical protein
VKREWHEKNWVVFSAFGGKAEPIAKLCCK